MELATTDIAANRRSRKWSRRELAGRALWAACRPLFQCSPKPFWGWRRFLLRLFGARIGTGVQIHPSARIFIPWNLHMGDYSSAGFDVLIYNLGRMTIGSRVTLSQRTHLCGGTHDYRDRTMPLIKAEIHVSDDVWICADAFIGPGVSIGKRAIVAARAVVVRNVSPETIVGGNPAKPIRIQS